MVRTIGKGRTDFGGIRPGSSKFREAGAQIRLQDEFSHRLRFGFFPLIGPFFTTELKDLVLPFISFDFCHAGTYYTRIDFRLNSAPVKLNV